MPNLRSPSAQSLLLQMQFQGQPLSTGTGFVVNSPHGPVLVTNRHNVTGRNQDTGKPLSSVGGVPDEIVIVHNRAGNLGEWFGVVESLYAASKARWIEHPTLGARADFVALPLTQLTDVQLYPYDVADTGPKISYGPADTVSVVGFPFGMQAGGSLAIWATGFVASEPVIDYNELPIFLIDCRSRPGQSGSPVIAYRSGGMVALEDGASVAYSGHVSRFLGIYSGRINEQSDLGIVWKASAIQELVSSIHPPDA